MALESTSPFGGGAGTGVSKGGALFTTESGEVDDFSRYPYNNSGGNSNNGLESPFNSVPHSNSVLNVNHSNSTANKDDGDGFKLDIKTSSLSSLSPDRLKTDSIKSNGSEVNVNGQCEEEHVTPIPTSKSDTSKCDTSTMSSGVSDMSVDGSSYLNASVGGNESSTAKFVQDNVGSASGIEEEMELSDDNEDLVECANCDTEFTTLQDYMDHTCGVNKTIESIKTSVAGDNMVLASAADVQKNCEKDVIVSDVESFDGKIVYNPDGSAYIIEGDSDSELESIISLPQSEGTIVDKKGLNGSAPSLKEIPQIDNAFFVPRNPNSLLSTNNPLLLTHKSQSTPIMHSYRVYDLRSRKGSKSDSNSATSREINPDSVNSRSPCNPVVSTSEVAASTPQSSSSLPLATVPPSSTHIMSVPLKPILMCFICKLSFGFAKSFMSHAISEHAMDLSEAEKDIMSRKNSSAIIQGIGKDKDPLMSFLEPIKSSNVDSAAMSSSRQPSSQSTAAAGTKINEKASSSSSIVAKETTSVSYVHTKPKLSDSCNDVASVVPSNQKQGKDLSIRDIRDQLAAKKFELERHNRSPSVVHAAAGNSFTKTERSEHVETKKLRLESTTSEDSNSNSQSNFQYNPMQRFLHEQDYSSQSPKSFLPTFTSPQRPGFYGACEEHPNGRAAGVECPSCDMVLGSSQSLGGHMTMMHSRNSCKTLKCPKCNWHYKYQETLEIHMKEKHPEGDQKCMYCLTNQTHPRLARGESYSCGYKPYRCEVCNYSTTTKGNLSIHMQSDKHLNNVQDLANSGGDLQQFSKHQAAMASSQQQQQQAQQAQHHAAAAAAAATQLQQQQQTHTPAHTATSSATSAIKTPPHQQILQHHHHHNQHPPTQSPQQQPHHQQQQQGGSGEDSNKKNKPKPTWRCDVCNYETNVARNLRIHMTSEKHTHNMMVLQQNMKHMQRDMQIHQMNQLVLLQQDPSFLGLTGPIPGGITFPYDGSLMMAGLPAGFGDAPVDLSKDNGLGIGPEGMPDHQDVNRLFQCCVCNIFGTDSLESLHQHLQMDRTKVHENENISVSNGTYLCNLCQYKTTLKANFQLHCKTDKHIQRLQLVNHIKEGGANNEWRLKYLNVSNPVQVRCNCCDYYTNSIHKLQIHTGNPRHEASAQLFCHLQQQESILGKPDRSYYCSLCKFNARTKLGLMQHVHSMQHLHSEGLKQIEMKEKGQLEVDIGDIFMVKEIHDIDAVKFDDESAAMPTVTSKLP